MYIILIINNRKGKGTEQTEGSLWSWSLLPAVYSEKPGVNPVVAGSWGMLRGSQGEELGQSEYRGSHSKGMGEETQSSSCLPTGMKSFQNGQMVSTGVYVPGSVMSVGGTARL